MKRPVVVVLGLAVAGLVMLSWTQTWFTVHLDASSAVVRSVDADGSKAVPQYTALALSSLALFLALTIAGPVVRIVLACIQVLLGVAVVVTGVTALSDPVRAAQGAVSAVAGVSDIGAVRAVVTSVQVTAWPVVGIVAGGLGAVLGVLVVVVQRSWPGPSRKYGGTARRADVPRDAVVDWDDLSAGTDPTDDDHAEAVDDRTVAVDGGDDPVGLTARRPTDGAHDNEEHREQH